MSSQKKVLKMVMQAKEASLKLAQMSTTEKNKALKKMAEALQSRRVFLMKENEKDIAAARRKGYSQALLGRLLIDEKCIRSMADCLRDTATLKDPVGEVLKTIRRPNGLVIKKVRTPFGAIAIIYESRPNVTSDCLGLCLKSGNAAILKGGKEARYSNQAIFQVLKDALSGTGIPPHAFQLIPSADRAAVKHLLEMEKYIDLVVPRGGESLIRFVAQNSLIPVIKHYKGVCHTFVSEKADLPLARRVCFNAKVQRPGVCNAMETLLVQRGIAKEFLPVMLKDYQEAGVEIRGCPLTRRIYPHAVRKATLQDWEEEYLDLILSVKVIDSLKDAIDHINRFGSRHSDAIITKDKKEAEQFFRSVDSACLYANASTRFTDGYEFGFGAEIGISTDKLHARGPMALEELTTYKYLIYGQGQVRQ